MDMTVSFRICQVRDGYISVAYNGKPNDLPVRYNDLKNTAACTEAVTASIKLLNEAVEAGTLPVGTYYLSLRPEGRKVRGFDTWEKDCRYVEVKAKA